MQIMYLSGLSAMEFPYRYQLDARGRTVEKGEAFTFTYRCLDAGFRPKAVGRCGHLIPMVAVPPGEGHEAREWKFLWRFQN